MSIENELQELDAVVKNTNIVTSDKFSQNWKDRLTRNETTKQIAYSYHNLKLLFDNDENLKSIFAFDSFRNIEVLRKKPVWNRPLTSGTDENSPFTDDDEVQVRNYVRATYGVAGDSTRLYSDIIKEKCLEHSYNPVTNYLNGCLNNWDKKERISTLFQEFLGVEDTPYNQEALTVMLVGAVARAYQPACKFDYMGIIAGSQGVGKSTILARLGREWFTDNLNGMNAKDDVQLTLGAWIIEDSELTAIKNSRIDQVKRFITRTLDTLRLPYGKRMVSYARRFVLWGTTNQATFLFDKTGTRRFLIFKSRSSKATKNVYHEFTDELVGQIWGEAVSLYKNGYDLKLSAEMEQEAEKVRSEYQNVDELQELLHEYLELPLPKEWYELDPHFKRMYVFEMLEKGFSSKFAGVESRSKVTIKEILTELLKLEFKDSATPHYKRQSKDVREAMKSLEDWEYKIYKQGGKTKRGYTLKEK